MAQLRDVVLDDKYALDPGRAFMSGVQALVRLPMLQRKRDALAGLNTAGFISGYRGSPLGGYDQALGRRAKHLAAHNIVFQPGVNEDLAATACWGTQQLGLYPARASSTACSASGTARARASTAARRRDSSTPTWPARRSTAACCCCSATTTSAKSSTAAHQSEYAMVDARCRC